MEAGANNDVSSRGICSKRKDLASKDVGKSFQLFVTKFAQLHMVVLPTPCSLSRVSVRGRANVLSEPRNA